MGLFKKTDKGTPAEPPAENDIQLSAFVLLSEDLFFKGSELVAALREDFPEMGWGGHVLDEVMGNIPQMTSKAVVCQMGCGPDIKPALINNMPSYQFLPEFSLFQANRCSPEMTAKVVNESNAYLNVAVWAPKDDLALRVEAGRRMAAICSVLAGLPIARAVVWHPSNRIVAPEHFVKCADDIRSGLMPFHHTTLPLIGSDPDEPSTVTARTMGFGAYLDAEIEVIQSPLSPEHTMILAIEAGIMAAQRGHTFQDGDTISHPEKPQEEEAMRLRYADASSHPTGRAHWVIVDNDSPFDHIKAYGPPPKRGGKRQQAGEDGWLKRRLTRDKTQ